LVDSTAFQKWVTLDFSQRRAAIEFIDRQQLPAIVVRVEPDVVDRPWPKSGQAWRPTLAEASDS
jgi:hypothetical protein